MRLTNLPAWPLATALCGALAGAAAQLQQSSLWPWWAYVGCLLVGLGLCRVGGRAQWGIGLGAVALLFGLTGGRAVYFQHNALPTELEGQNLVLEGRVASLPRQGENGWQFEFAVESARLNGATVAVPERVRLSWSEGFAPRGADTVDRAPKASAVPALRAGERWRFTARLRQPHGLANPHGFDTELWLWEQGLHATGYVRHGKKDPEPVLLGATWRHPVERMRQAVRDDLQAQVSRPRAAAVMTALVVGDQAAIDNRDWDVLRVTGVSHLISVSGTHITMFAKLATLLIGIGWRWLGVRWPAGLWRWPAPVAATLGGLLLATLYALFSGWAVPAQRTVWMLATVAVLRLSGRRWPWPLVWLAAMGTVVVLDPWALLQPGFWLSFVAVGVLFASGIGGPSSVWDWRGHLKAMLRAQAVVTVALAPLALMLFGQWSVVGVLANLLAIPWVTLWVTPLALLGAVLPGLWALVAWAVDVMLLGLQWLASWPGAALERPVVPWPLAALAVLGGGLLVLRWPWRWRAWGALLLWPALSYSPPRPTLGAFDLLAADVGQGTAVVVRTARHTLLYDTGPPMGPQADAGQRVLLPLLRGGNERLDAVVLSHNDNDHTGGAASIAQAQVRLGWRTEWWASFDTTAQGLPPATRCEAGQRWVWDGVPFEVLHPRAEDHERGLKDNALSCVIKVGEGAATALLTGDLPAAEEARVLRDHPELRAALLMAGHHGSHTSSSAAWLDTLRPGWIVVQAGYRNRYGHPAPEVVQRYNARGIPWVASPACGAATWHSREPGVVHCLRDTERRYWQHQPATARHDPAQDNP